MSIEDAGKDFEVEEFKQDATTPVDKIWGVEDMGKDFEVEEFGKDFEVEEFKW